MHRPSYLDYIGVKRFNEQGEVIGEQRFLGLYTSAAYNQNRATSRCCAWGSQGAGAGRPPPLQPRLEVALLNILETFPRDELFQISDDQLFETAMGMRLGGAPPVRLFMWRDDYGRFVSALNACAAPRPATRPRSPAHRRPVASRCAFPGARLTSRCGCPSPSWPAAAIIRMRRGQMPSYDAKELEAKLATVTRSWSTTCTPCCWSYAEEEGNALFDRYGEAFPAAYVDDFPARNAVYDIQRMEDLAEQGGLNMNLYRPPTSRGAVPAVPGRWPHTFSDAVPMLEDIGVEVVEERPASCARPGTVRSGSTTPG